MKRIIIITALCFSLNACITTQPINTASGKPEVTICKSNKTDLMNMVTSTAISKGYSIKSANDYQIVVTKPISNLVHRIIVSSTYDTSPEERLVWMFADIGNNCTHLGIALQNVTAPNTGREKIRDISTGAGGASLQEWLENLKAKIEGYSRATPGERKQAAYSIEKLKEAIEEEKPLAEAGNAESQKRIEYYNQRINTLENKR